MWRTASEKWRIENYEAIRLSALQKESQRCPSPESLKPKRILRRVRWRKDCAVIFSHFSAAEIFCSTFFKKSGTRKKGVSKIYILRRAKFSMFNEKCSIINEKQHHLFNRYKPLIFRWSLNMIVENLFYAVEPRTRSRRGLALPTPALRRPWRNEIDAGVFIRRGCRREFALP